MTTRIENRIEALEELLKQEIFIEFSVDEDIFMIDITGPSGGITGKAASLIEALDISLQLWQQYAKKNKDND